MKLRCFLENIALVERGLSPRRKSFKVKTALTGIVGASIAQMLASGGAEPGTARSADLAVPGSAPPEASIFSIANVVPLHTAFH